MITIAKTKEGEFINAKNATSGIIYYCVHCDCPMYRKLSRAKNPFFACRSGNKHTSPECQKSSESLVTHDPEITDSEAFHHHILTPPKRGTGGAPGEPHEPPVPTEHTVPFQSLEALWNSGLTKSGNIPIANGRLSDILLSNRLAHMVMRNNTDIGPRVLEVTPDFCFDKTQTIRFLLFGVIWQKAGSPDLPCRKVIDFHIASREVYDRLVRKFFLVSVDDATGKRVMKSRYKSVLIHGNWSATAFPACKEICRQECNRKWKCTGHQSAEYISSRQVYCPPTQRVDSK